MKQELGERRFGEQHVERKGNFKHEKLKGKTLEKTEEPRNLVVIWGRSTASNYEIFISDSSGRSGDNFMVAKHQAIYGDQLDEAIMAQGIYDAHNIAIQNPERTVYFYRLDDERHVPENPLNAPYRFIDGEWRKEV